MTRTVVLRQVGRPTSETETERTVSKEEDIVRTTRETRVPFLDRKEGGRNKGTREVGRKDIMTQGDGKASGRRVRRGTKPGLRIVVRKVEVGR